MHSCTLWLRPPTSLPPHFDSYTRALLVSQDRPPANTSTVPSKFHLLYIRVIRGHCSVYSMDAGKYLLEAPYLVPTQFPGIDFPPLNPSKNLASGLERLLPWPGGLHNLWPSCRIVWLVITGGDVIKIAYFPGIYCLIPVIRYPVSRIRIHNYSLNGSGVSLLLNPPLVPVQ